MEDTVAKFGDKKDTQEPWCVAKGFKEDELLDRVGALFGDLHGMEGARACADEGDGFTCGVHDMVHAFDHMVCDLLPSPFGGQGAFSKARRVHTVKRDVFGETFKHVAKALAVRGTEARNAKEMLIALSIRFDVKVNRRGRFFGF